MTNPEMSVVCVADRSRERLAENVNSLYPGVRTVEDARELIGDPSIDAVVIATPVHSHFELALAALEAGKHVLVEKPIASSAAQAQTLIEHAGKHDLLSW